MYYYNLLNTITQLQIFLFFISILSTFLVLKFYKTIANHTKLFDYPDNYRKIHKIKTPIVSIFSIIFFFICIIGFNFFFDLINKDIQLILILSLIFFLIGIADDKYDLNPYKKILLKSLVLYIFIPEDSSLIINKIFLFHQSSFFFLNKYSTLFTIFCILALINSLNLLDGINGIAIGFVIVIIFYLIFFFENNFNLYLIFILINLCFIFYYIYKGRMFLGNNGIFFLSAFLSLTLIYYINNYWIENYNSKNWSLDIKIGSEHIFIMLLLPGIDMLRLFFSRILNKKDPFSSDKKHLHHFLIQKFNLNKTLLIYFFLMNLFIIIGFNYKYYKILFLTIFFIGIYFFLLFSLKKNLVKH